MSFSTLVISSLLTTVVVAKPIQSLQERATVPIAGYDYAGCYTDSVTDRTFTSKTYFDDAMTIEKCAAACQGFTWFGLEYGRECYCGDTPKSSSSKVEEAYCSTSCPGDATETCGAGDHLTTYAKTGTLTEGPSGPATYGSLGCYTEPSSGRALPDAVFTDPAMTVDMCAAKCAGFPFFGLEYATECYCGTELQVGSVQTSQLECHYSCAGDRTQSCGGDWRLNVYELGAATVVAPVETSYTRQGCYAEAYTSVLGQGRRALTDKSFFDDAMTVEKCSTACAGYTWFGLEYGRECYCGLEINPGSVITDDADCYFACPGDDTEKCGAGDRLDMYKFGAAVVLPTTTTTSSVQSTTSSTTSSSDSSTTTTLITTTSVASTTASETTTTSSTTTSESTTSTTSQTTTTSSLTTSSTATSESPTTTSSSSVSSTTSDAPTTTSSSTTSSPSPTTTSTTTTTTTTTTMTTTTTTSESPIPTCLSRSTPFRMQSTDYNGTPLQVYANLFNPTSGSTWWGAQPPSTAASTQNKYIWSLDSNGYIKLAYNIPPYKYTLSMYMSTKDVGTQGTGWPQVGIDATVQDIVSSGPYTYIKGCIDSISGEVKVDGAGRKNLLWCGSEMWLGYGNGEDINRVCVRMFPMAIDP